MHFIYRMDLSFSGLVREHHFTLRFVPRTSPRQMITNLTYRIDPCRTVWEGTDAFGNLKQMGYLREAHDHLSAVVSGDARIIPGGADSAFEPVMKYETRLTSAGDIIRGLANQADSLSDGAGFAEKTMHTVYRALTYRPGSTDNSTTAEEAARAGCGVCQDYAHIMLAILRSRRIPCRYVCGMLSGEGASHAWVEVLEDGRWIGYDPTNDVPASDAQIVISHGRDALDCRINQGIFLEQQGSPARQSQAVAVVVSPDG